MDPLTGHQPVAAHAPERQVHLRRARHPRRPEFGLEGGLQLVAVARATQEERSERAGESHSHSEDRKSGGQRRKTSQHHYLIPKLGTQ